MTMTYVVCLYSMDETCMDQSRKGSRIHPTAKLYELETTIDCLVL